MPYTLQRLAAGSYDLLLDGDVVGSVVRSLSKGGDSGDAPSGVRRSPRACSSATATIPVLEGRGHRRRS